MTAVSIMGLGKDYAPDDEPAALSDLSLNVNSGEMVALLGPSGCGKTTALKILAGLSAPTKGDVSFDGKPVLNLPPEQRGAVMVFQNALLFPYMSVAANIGFGLRMRRLPKTEIADRVEKMLTAVRLPGYGDRKPSELSGGQAQRVALARALILQPAVLLLDEPLSNLDAHLRADMRDLICTLQRETRITTLFVTHDQAEAVTMADRVALLLDGRLRQFDLPEAFYRHPADVDVARFFGAANFVPGKIVGGSFHSAIGPLILNGAQPNRPGTLTIRPESIRLGAAEANSLIATVRSIQFQGTQTTLRLMVAEVPLEMSLPPDQAIGIAAGQSLTIHLPPSALWVMQ
jgi:ABC-type Fe3+/spermidine/putrescine transport system ATPase subunit